MAPTIIYLAGPIHGCSDQECHGWRQTLEQLTSPRIEFLNPLRRDYRGREEGNEGQIVAGDLQDIRKSDLVVARLERPSWGTAMELFAAHIYRVPVWGIHPEGPRSPWLTAFVSRFFPDTERVAAAINTNWWLLATPPAWSGPR